MTISETIITNVKRRKGAAIKLPLLLSLFALCTFSLSETVAVDLQTDDIIEPDAIDDFINDSEKEVAQKSK